MKTNALAASTAVSPLVLSWLCLVTLTLLSLALSQWSTHGMTLQMAVAGILWLKGWIVAHYFIESHRAHPFVAGLLRVFVLCVPLALILTTWFGGQFLKMTTL